MTPSSGLVRELRRQGAEIQIRSKHLLVLRAGRRVTILPRGPVENERGRQHANALANLRRAGFDV